MNDWPLVAEAATQFLRSIAAAEAFQILLRPSGETWSLAISHGTIDQALTLASAESFAPDEAGTVQPLADPRGWLARYSCAAPGLEMCVLMRFSPLAPEDLQPGLESLEERCGWLMIAALRDIEGRKQSAAPVYGLTLSLLSEAAGAVNEENLAQHWISRLEKHFLPDAVLVIATPPLGNRLIALSGGAGTLPASEKRDAAESLAGCLRDSRQPVLLAPATAESSEPALTPDPRLAAQLLPQCEALGFARCLALPVPLGDAIAMVVVLGWSEDTAATPQPVNAEGCAALCRALGDSLSIHRRAWPRLTRKLANRASGMIATFFGKRAWKLKLTALAMATTLILLAILPGQERPGFNARLATEERRVIAAPFDGYLSQAPWRVGDIVPEGALLMAMNEAELLLQRAMTEAELTRLAAQARLARAGGDIAALRGYEAEISQTEMRLQLTDQQISAASVTASGPVQILAGDANSRIGARLRLGEPLLEIGDPGSMVVLAQIDEDWVSQLAPGMTGDLLLSAWPDRPLAVKLDQITASAQMAGGRNTFSSRLVFTGDIPADLRAAMIEGMRGLVRIEAGQASQLAIYTRSLRRWLQSQFWRLG